MFRIITLLAALATVAAAQALTVFPTHNNGGSFFETAALQGLKGAVHTVISRVQPVPAKGTIPWGESRKTYDAKGYLLSHEEYMDGKLLTSSTYVFGRDYRTCTETDKRRPVEATPSVPGPTPGQGQARAPQMPMETRVIKYTYNAKGQWVAQRIENGKVLSTTTYTFAKGHLVTSVKVVRKEVMVRKWLKLQKARKDVEVERTTYKYDQYGNVTAVTSVKQSGMRNTETTVYNYAKNSVACTIKQNQYVVMRLGEYYSNDGLLIKSTNTSASTTLLTYTKFDTTGNWITCTRQDASNPIEHKDISTREITYYPAK